MEQPTVRVELPGGAWAVLYRDVLRKTARLQEAELRRHMTPVSVETFGQADSSRFPLSELQAGKEPPKKDYIINFDEVDNNIVNEAYVLNQVKEWSFSEISAEAIGMLSREQYDALVKEMDRLYKPIPLGHNAG